MAYGRDGADLYDRHYGMLCCCHDRAQQRQSVHEPGVSSDTDVFRQVLRIAFISPWAFIGFETVSHSSEEYRFRHSRMFRILVISTVVTTALYIFVILMSVTAYPEGCSGWLDYISRLDEFDGIAGLPAFYAANRYLGQTGVNILMASLLSLVLTSLIGMLRALGRLCYAVAKDGILPERFARLNDRQIPVNAILLVLVVSLPIPFLGRTAIGWIVMPLHLVPRSYKGLLRRRYSRLPGRRAAKNAGSSADSICSS